MMRWMLWIVAGLAVLVLIVAIVGAILPKAHVASRTARVAMPPEALYALLADVDRYQSWRPDVKSLQRLPDREGKPAWIEDVGGMKIPMHFERLERPAVIVSRIDGASLPFGGAWTYQIAPAPGGSDLTITENGEVSNVIFRFMSRFVFGHHATMDGFIKHLQAKAGQ
jgi:ribosome-associated toxin RatA of RatAB toxin-antitoxin module